jgi:hypothetical protein
MFKKTYTEPAIYIEDVIVENGIAQSLQWGQAGDAGQGGDGYYDDSYGDL